jgi:hypothetical protein
MTLLLLPAGRPAPEVAFVLQIDESCQLARRFLAGKGGRFGRVAG